MASYEYLRGLVTVACLAAFVTPGQAIDSTGAAGAPRTTDIPVTAVAGESWLNHLHRSFGDTSMGKTGHLGPPQVKPGKKPQAGEQQYRSSSFLHR